MKFRRRRHCRSRRRAQLLLAALAAWFGLALSAATPGAPDAPEADAEPGAEHINAGDIVLISVDGVINAATAAHISAAIEAAQQRQAGMALIELDTPGGVVTDTKEIIQQILNAEIPVVVYVAPRGAWAGSAGTFITIAAHIAVMAPGTTIGAAHPVTIGENPKPENDEDGKPQHTDYAVEKAENLLASYLESVAKERGRNIEWAAKAVRDSIAATADEAVELKVVDFIADDREDLLQKLEGREVNINGETRTLALREARITEYEMDRMGRLFHALANPNIIWLLGLIGVAGLYIEFNSPGLIVPGLVGVLCLVLAALGMQTLPFDWTGFVIIAIGLGFVIAEAFAPTYGILLVLGLGLILYGGVLIFDRPELSDLKLDFWPVLFPTVACFGVLAALAIFALRKLPGLAQQSGVHELIGRRGSALTALSPAGTVAMRGEYWQAVAEENIEAGARVIATGVDGLELRVRRAPGESAPPPPSPPPAENSPGA